MSKLIKLGIGIGGLGLGVYTWDKQLNHSTFGRNIRTVITAAQIAYDYKFHFNENNVDKIDEIHKRTANRILNCCQLNGGVYIKLGQQIAQQSAMLPKAYGEVFKVMYDRAPSAPYEQIKKIFVETFNKQPEELFQKFEKEPIASASIAQVHKAWLKDGTLVAVKIQKPQLEKQMDYDMFAYRSLCYVFEKLFDLPIYWVTEYTEKHLRMEMDFINEAKNSERCNFQIQQNKSLKENMHVPKVYYELSNKKVLTTEWIDGIPLTDPKQLELKGFDGKKIIHHLVNLFAYQIFSDGYVHGDPHPGNILIRKNPVNQKLQIVILDHGLYIKESKLFQHQYALLWKSLFLNDTKTLQLIGQQWGIKDMELFATATLLRPYNTQQSINLTSSNLKDDSLPFNTKEFNLKEIQHLKYQQQLEAKKRVRSFLKNTHQLPLELIFVGRNMNIMRANNAKFGSPVNRISLMADQAVKSLNGDWSIWTLENQNNNNNNNNNNNLFNQSLQWSISNLRYFQFQFSLFLFKLSFNFHQLYRLIMLKLFKKNTLNLEDTLTNNVKQSFENQFGIEMGNEVEL